MLCRMAKLSAEEARKRVQQLSGWTLEGEVIKKLFTFPDFPGAVSFIVRLGFAAESVDHHPDLLVNYKRVTVSFSTHSEGGLTDKDFEGAQTASTIAAAMGGE
jgi:4a-hydroxytetrahydrobiopterin dehydratase